MTIKSSALVIALVSLTTVALADNDAMPSYAQHAVYPGALMTQGFFINADGLYTTKDLLAANTTSNGSKVSLASQWGFAGHVGYEGHFGQTGMMIAGIEGGYRYMGKLSVANVSSDFKLQAATGMVDLGLQMGRMDVIAKGGAAVELGGKYLSGSDVSTTVYRFSTQVVPMAGGELGFALMPNVKLSAECDYLFGHQMTSDRLGAGSADAPKNGYKALTALVGLSYYMN